MADPEVRVTQYTVSLLPEDDPPGSTAWDVKVEYRGNDRWAVTNLSRCLTTDGEWDEEPIPSSRTDAWLSTHRFTHDDALAWAKKVVGTVRWNGKTADDLRRS